MHLREASSGDIPIMAKHHRKMFEEICERKGERLDPVRALELEKSYARKLGGELISGTCKAWIIEDGGNIISSGGFTIISLVPNPSDVSCKVGYLHSMFTERSHRNRKCAGRILGKVIEYCKSAGIKRILLNASEAGQPIYQKMGFRPALDMMRLIIE
jgi:GNAT superfamily N-acetyltransferase